MGDSTLTFVAAVRRRAGVAGVVERAGVWLCVAAVGVAVAAAVARSYPAAAWTAAVLLCLGGSARVVRRWPTAAEAADRVDAAFGWPDLVGSAVRVTPGDDFAAAVVAAADAACRSRSPADVAVRRVTNRAWVGRGLSVAAAAVVVACLGPARTTAAADPAAIALGATDDPPPPAETARPVVTPHNSGESVDRSQSDDGSPVRSTDDPAAAADRHPAGRGTGVAAPAAGGANGGASSSPPPHDAPPVAAVDPVAGGGRPASAGTDPAGGGHALAAGEGHDDPAGTAAGRVAPPAVPPWESAGWSTAREAAAAAVSDGDVPANRRGLVRAYFDLR